MKFKNILMALGLGSMLMTSCTLDEEVYTFISGEDLSADGEYELLVNGAYQPLAWMFEWGGGQRRLGFCGCWRGRFRAHRV